MTCLEINMYYVLRPKMRLCYFMFCNIIHNENTFVISSRILSANRTRT